jgi:hypothetical protein
VATGDTYRGVGATWIVPEAENTAQTGHATWVGIGGFGKSDLIQSGTIALTDEPGKTVYLAWYELLPEAAIPLPIPITAGDEVSVSIIETKPDQWTMSFSNNTTATSVTQVLQYDSKKASADFIQEMLTVGAGKRVPIDRFETTTFTDAWVMRGSKKVDLVRARAAPVTLIDRKRRSLAVPSAISESRDSFSVTRTETPASITSIVQDSRAGKRLRDTSVLFDIRARTGKDGRSRNVRILEPTK